MVNNQIEFNKKYSDKEIIKEIKIETEDFEEKQLEIENYLNLEKLYLYDIQEIEKIKIKNLTQLQECTIWDCGVKELIIENCPQIRKLNVRRNLLTSLEFLKGLENLEYLEMDGNTGIDFRAEYFSEGLEIEKSFHDNIKLIEILRLYGNNWKTCKEDIQEIFELTKQNNPLKLTKKFWDLKKSREELKKEVSSVTGHSTTSRLINTKELVSNLGKEFKEKEAKIDYLEFRVWELTELSKKQQEEVKNYLSRFGSEEELLKKLIKVHLEFTKIRKQKQPVIKLKRQKDEIYKELEEKLNNEEMMEKVEVILTNCESLVEQELEIENNLNNQSSLIKEQKQKLASQTDNSGKEKLKEQEETHQNQVQQSKKARSNSVITEIAGLKGQITAKNEIIKELLERPLTPIPENQDESLIDQLIGELKEKSTLVSEEQVKELLGAKKIFLNTRQITIKGLQNCYNKLKGNKKYDKAGEVGNVISAGGTVAESLTFGVPKAFGEAIIAINNSFKKRFSDKRTEEFKELLINDKDDLSILEDIIVNNKILRNKNSETRLFSNKYEIFEIDHSIWRDKPFVAAEEMDAVIILLNKNLEELNAELDQEEKQFKRFLDDQSKNRKQFQIQIPPK